jgi:hypothetical protein
LPGASSPVNPTNIPPPQDLPEQQSEPIALESGDVIVELQDDGLLVELDESHIISNAIN